MGNEAYQQRKNIDLTPGEDGLIHVPKNIVVYLTQDQVEATWSSLCDYAEKNGKVKNFSEINNCIFVGNTSNIITPNSVYGKFSEEDVDTLENLNMVPKLNDANRLAQTDKDYNKENPDYIPNDQNFPLKIWNWYDKGLIDKDQHNAIIRGILFSSGSVHNDWVYSLTGEDSGRDKDPAIFDIHDRRIDDPNVPLTVKGGVNVGDPDNATDRKKLSVFGETELQDGSTFGRLLDTFGEQFPMYFGHLIPDHGQYYKVYINRGEDRYNGEDWDDQTYGTGFGTVEAYKEIVSHTTINADRGMIIEDGLGDRTDKIIRKTRDENNHTHFDPTGAATHETNGFALSIHHDGAKVKGHTYIQDEGSANRFFKENDIIYKANVSAQNGFETVDTNSIKKNCWFCVDNNDSTDWQYRHFCTTKDNDVEPVVDRWYGHLYYEGTRTIKGREGWKYCYNGEEYYYDGTFHKIENHKNVQPGEIFTLGDDLATYYRMEENPLSKVLEQYQYKFVGIYTDVEQDENPDGIPPVYYVKGMTITVDQVELEYTANLRVRPETNKVYQIKDPYTETDTLYGLIDIGTYTANTYLYWDGIKFKPITEPRNSYNQKQDYGSLTVGTRANGEQDNDTIGRNSLEVGKENEATGDNAVANGQATTAAALNSHAEGLGTEVKSTGLLSHIEGLGDYSELVEYQDENDFFGEGGGRPSEVSGIASHAEGYGQKVEGKYSHAEGRLNQILGNDTIASHAEGSENIIEDTVGTSHAEGVLNKITKNKYDEQSPVNKFATEGAHVEGAGNIIDRRYQHLEGVLAKTTHDVDQYYDDGSTPTEKPVVFAIGDGDSPTRENAQGNTPADRIIENREDPTYKRSNLFAVTEDGDTYVAGHLEVDGTSDLSGRATIGDSVADHSDANPALDVLKHSRFREKVTIERDGQATADLDMTWPTDDISLAVKGESLFGDTLTIGEAGDRDEETGTFWANLDESDPFNAKSAFNGLYVHGEIHNERIPQELYTSIPVGQDIVLNEFADKFFVNSSIATSTATYRGSFSAINYAPHLVEKINDADSSFDPTNYTVKTCDKNLPTKYTNQLIFIHDDAKPIIFQLTTDWIIGDREIHPYNTSTGIIVVENNQKKIKAGYYKFYYDYSVSFHEEVTNYNQLPAASSESFNKIYYVTATQKYYRCIKNTNNTYSWIETKELPIINTESETEKVQWLKNYITDNYLNNLAADHKVNAYSDLKQILTPSGIYYVISEDTFYQKVDSEWEECNPVADKNDYCYFQIWDRKVAEPYVLFAEQYDDNGNPLNALPTQTEDDLEPELEMEIICERYKFIVANNPTNSAERESYWKFEYQLNNSGFTQAQWAAINSGISDAWMSEIERLIKEITTHIGDIDEIISSLPNNYVTVAGNNQNITGWKTVKQIRFLEINQNWNDPNINSNNFRWIKLSNNPVEDTSSYYLPRFTDKAVHTLALRSDLEDYVKLSNLEGAVKALDLSSKYVTITGAQEISGKKNFTNPDGIGLDGAYLKRNTYSAGTFLLPDQADSEGVVLLSTLDLEPYLKTADLLDEIKSLDLSDTFVTLTGYQEISGKKNFTNPDGIGFDGVYLKKGNTSANVGPFTLPTSGSGELALKSDLDTISGSVKNDFVLWNGLTRLENGGGTVTFQKESQETINGYTVYTGNCTIIAPLRSKSGNEGTNSIELDWVWKQNDTQFYYAGGIVAEDNWLGQRMELDSITISKTNFTNTTLNIKLPVNWANHTGILVLYIHGIKFL